MKSRNNLVFMVLLIMAGTVLFGGCQKNDPQVAKSYQKGVLAETSFESEYLNLRFTAPEGYVMATEEDMLGLVDFGAEVAYSDADKKIVDYAKANTVYEMMVSEPSGVPNIIVIVEKLSLSQITIDQYLDKVKEDMSGADGLSYVFDDKTTTVDFAGQNYTKLSMTLNEMVIQDYMIRKEDNRMVSIITTYTEDTKPEMENLLKNFEKY